jgi:DNA-binding transcriptional ArsR family regulator
MRDGCWYRPADLAAATGLARSTVGEYLAVLYRHGMVERLAPQNRPAGRGVHYMTRQCELQLEGKIHGES